MRAKLAPHIICIGLLLASTAALAEEKISDPDTNIEDQDISKLADQYWRPGMDELGVIQDRAFEKTHHIEFSLLGGYHQGGDYLRTRSYGFALAYHWSNEWAVEASTLHMSSQSSDFLTAVQSQYGFTPNYNQELRQHSLAVAWTPIYAKFALLGKHISHFETYLAPGVGITQTTQNNFTKHISIGEKFFLTQKIVLRVEWKISQYTDTIAAPQGAYSVRNGGSGFFEQTQTTHNLLFGIGCLF